MSLKKHFRLSRKTVFVTSLILLISIITATVAIVVSQKNATPVVTKQNTEQPQFSTILPTDKSIEKLGGWSRVSPPSSEPVFAYNDKIGIVSISVSQQPLPKLFTTDLAGQISNLAKQYGAEQQLTAGDTKVYIGSSSKGPQSVIFSKDNLLILIKSQQKIANKDWSQYIESLN